MRSGRTALLFSTASAALAFALTATDLLPDEHMHLAGIEGRSHAIVHRHSLETSAATPLGTSIAAHGSHDRALFLRTFYNSSLRCVAHPPAILETALFSLPSFGPLEAIPANNVHYAHGPPGAMCLTRAPPSFI